MSLRLVLEHGDELDYVSENIGLSLNRIVDDFANPEKRHAEFSYMFSLPRSSNNSRIWNWPDVKGRTHIFSGKQLDCKLIYNNTVLLDGLIELSEINAESYGCHFFSKYVELLDSIRGKKLVDLTSLPIIPWEYEKTIVEHIRANYADADETDYQFPFSFYKTPYISGFTGTTKFENNMGFVYNYVESFLNFSNKNPTYYTSWPPSIYIKSILKAVLFEAGWSLGGSFFQRDDVKKMVVLYTGDPEIFTGAVVTGITDTLNLSKVLPDMGQIDFLKGIINMFNLYISVDRKNKAIRFETEPVLFNSSANAIDLTDKIDANTIVKSKALPEPNISFTSDDDNDLVCGFGRTFSYDTAADRDNPTYWLNPVSDLRATTNQGEIFTTYAKNAFENLWNSNVGSSQEIRLPFSPVNYFSYGIINEKTDDNVANSSGYVDTYTIGVPLLSPQTPNDNDGYFFDEVDSGLNNCSANSATQFQYIGGIKIAYYMGLNTWNLNVGSKDFHQFRWVGIATGGTCEIPTFARVSIPVATPFKLISTLDKNKLVERIDTWNTTNEGFNKRFSELGAEAHSLLLTYYSLALTGTTYDPTHFSLTFGNNPDFFADNLYTYFYKKKFDRLKNGYLLKATIYMNENDWNDMQIHKPLLYNGEYFQLVSIQSFNPIEKTASITMLKR